MKLPEILLAAQPSEGESMGDVRPIRISGYLNIEGGEYSMDLQAITTLIGSLGFPIAACVAMFAMLNKEREEHKAEMNKVTEAISNNTLALQALKDKLESHD